MSGAAILGVACILKVFNIVVCFRLHPMVIQERTSGICPVSVAETRANASQRLFTILQNNLTVPECGPGYWVQVASLNLTDPQQSCPSPWVMETTPGRSCAAASRSCASVYFDTFGVMYQKVCGMALGYATGTPDALRDVNRGIDGVYLDGVSITHGQPRRHIWSLAAGHGGNYRCPCDNTGQNQGLSFIGNNYFCDDDFLSGNVWDGENCTTACCTFNNPPWFAATLPAPTSDSIEARICQNQRIAVERVFLHSLYLFVQ